jgi:hypothetical protein
MEAMVAWVEQVVMDHSEQVVMPVALVVLVVTVLLAEQYILVDLSAKETETFKNLVP